MKEKLKLKILFCLFGLATLTFTGCVKQSDCGCSMTGQFIYLDEPYYTGPDYYKPNTKIVAHFIQDSTVYPIFGYIPHGFRNLDTLDVSVCIELKQQPEYEYIIDMQKGTFSLECIENEN